METKRAVVKGIQLFGGDLAVAKFLEYQDPNSVVYGWLLMQQDQQKFEETLSVYDETNGYNSNPKFCWYRRSIIDAYVLDELGQQTGQKVSAYIYHKKHISASREIIHSGDWIQHINKSKTLILSDDALMIKRICNQNDEMDLERIPIEEYQKNIKRYYKYIVNEGVSDTEFFEIIRNKNANLETVKLFLNLHSCCV